MKALIIISYILALFLIWISILNNDIQGIAIGALFLAVLIFDFFNLFK